MKRLFTEKEVREIIGENEEVLLKKIDEEHKIEKAVGHKIDYSQQNEAIRNRFRQKQRAILEKMRGEGGV